MNVVNSFCVQETLQNRGLTEAGAEVDASSRANEIMMHLKGHNEITAEKTKAKQLVGIMQINSQPRVHPS